MTDRKFRHVAAVTIDRHAGAIGQLVEALNQTNASARVSREFVADLSVRIDLIGSDLLTFRDRTFLGRLRWLLTGK